MSPFLDEDGVMRMHGRLEHADFLAYDTRYLIILPRRGELTRLIVQEYHRKGHHTGVNHTFSLLRQRLGVLVGRKAVLDAEVDCYACKQLKARPLTQVMAPLPRSRFKEPLRAFIRVSMDFTGPFVTIQGRGQRRAKRYLCLTTCLTSRAVHLEMTSSLSTDAFLETFYRMTVRRGLPEEVWTDWDKLAQSESYVNFVGAERELREFCWRRARVT